MPQIDIDVTALAERIKNDQTIAHWEREKEQLRGRQTVKKKELEARVATHRASIKQKQTVVSEQMKEIRRLRIEINRARRSLKFRSADMRRIEQHISHRKRQLKYQEVKRATALARKKVEQLMSFETK